MFFRSTVWLVLLWLGCIKQVAVSENLSDYEGKVVKGNRNALFLVRKGVKRQFPDFNTFIKLGYNTSMIVKIPDDILRNAPSGEIFKPIPVYRPDDYMYHQLCDDPERMVNDLGLIGNMGDFMRFLPVLQRIKSTKQMNILTLGGSITAGGYFMEFVRNLNTKEKFNVTVHNHGHGATELTYTIFCVDIDRYRPDLVMIDFSVNDYGHPKLMDALIRKALSMPSKPIVLIANLWVHKECPITRYSLHSFYYQLPLISVCPAVNLCFGKNHLPKDIWEQYSKTDGVHPWGSKGVKFLGDIFYAWWQKIDRIVNNDMTFSTAGVWETHQHSFENLAPASSSFTGTDLERSLPPPLYVANPIGRCTRCDALADDADGILTPSKPPVGFRKVTRMKIGYGGFNPADKNSATKSFKRSWMSDKPGSSISFKFFGSSVKIAIWQRRDSMGIIDAHIDQNKETIASASGFFKGFSWAMEKNNTGRSEIITLFEGLEDAQHELTLTVSDQPANTWVKGHVVQVFAILSASDNLNCKNMTL